MRFQFYLLASGDMGVPALSPVGPEFELLVNNTMGTLREDAIARAEAMFSGIVRDRQPGDGQIVLMTTTLGEPPGAIIAVEAIDPIPRQRRLQWAWSDGTIHL